MHSTHIDLPATTRNDIIAMLEARLVDAIDLALQAKLAHWNVRGPHFIALHDFFDKVEEQIQEQVDILAERIGQLGGIVRATVQDVAKSTSLAEFNTGLHAHDEILETLVKAMATYTNNTRKNIDSAAEKGDSVTADIFTGLSREADKYLWFLESHLKK